MVVLSKRGTKNKEGGENGKRERRHAPEEDEDNRDRNARVERGGQDVCTGRPVRKNRVEYGGNRPSQASGQSTSKRRMASGDKNSAPRYHHHPVPVESSRVGSGGGRPDVSVERRRGGGGAEGSMSADIHSHGLSQRLSPSSTIVPKTHSYTLSTTRNGGGG